MASRAISSPRVTRRLAVTAAATVAALALAACSSGGSGGGSGASGSASGPASYGQISVQYSWIKDEEFAGEYYAYEKGYYKDAGFSDVVGVSGPDTGVAKLLSGQVQVALSDAASVGAAIAEQQAPLKIIGTTFQKNPFTIISLKNRADITTPKDLIGKKIGVQDSNASVFQAILAANGIDPSQVTVVPVQFDPTPLMKGEIDGYMGYLTNEQLTVQLAGYDVQSLPYADNGVPYVAETVTVTDDYLKSHRDLLKAFLTAEIKGWTDVFQQPTDDTVSLITKYYNQAAAVSGSSESGFGTLDPKKTGMGVEAEEKLISTDETKANGLFTISDQLEQQTLASLKAAGWDVTADQLFDTSLVDEIYQENPGLKAYLP